MYLKIGLYLAVVSLVISSLFGCLKLHTASGPTPPPCELRDTSPAPVMKASEKTFDISFDQSKVQKVMSLPAHEDVCFVRLQGNVSVYKTEMGPSYAPPSSTWVNLPASPAELEARWKNYQTGFHLDIMGLTALSYWDLPERKEVVSAQIVLSTRGRPWHLWHELSHLLIAQERAKDARKGIAIPTPDQLASAKETFVKSFEEGNEADAANDLIQVFNVHRDYDEHVFLEEIVIETSLIHNSLELREDLFKTQISGYDLPASFSLIEHYLTQHARFHQALMDELKPMAEQNNTLLEIWQKRSDEQAQQNIELIQLKADLVQRFVNKMQVRNHSPGSPEGSTPESPDSHPSHP